MRPDSIERVFGRSRLRMVTGEHVEVFREEAQPGERRRYTKRFLSSMGSDFRYWTEREWRMLARLVGHGIAPVPDVVQFDRGAPGRPALVQTYDAGITVDHWATLLPVEHEGQALHHVFEDCAHWWALARHALMALEAIHALQVVHLDLKADNICVPHGPTDFDPWARGEIIHPQLGQLALIDFAFSLVSGEALEMPLPIGQQTDCDYQSPRLLQALEAGRRGNPLPTRQLDWRCDIYSLAAMLRRYLSAGDAIDAGGWNERRLADALSFVRRLVDAHDRASPAQRPHQELIVLTSRVLRERELSASLLRGWQLSREPDVAGQESATPVTRIAWPITPMQRADRPPTHAVLRRLHPWLWATGAIAFGALAAPWLQEQWSRWRGEGAPSEVASAAPAPEPAVVAQAPAQRDEPAASLPQPPFDVITPAPPVAASAPVAAASAVREEVSTPTPVEKRTASPHREAAKAKTLVASGHAPQHVAAAAPRMAAKSAGSRVSTKPALVVPHKSWFASLPVTAMARGTPAPAPPFGPAAGPVRGHRPAGPSAPPVGADPPTAVALASPPAQTPPPGPAPAPAAVVTPATVAMQAIEPPPKPLPDDFGARAATLLAEQLPRAAQQAERRVLQVLHVAAQAEGAGQSGEIAEAAAALHRGLDSPLPAGTANTADAKSLAQAAESAFWSERNAPQALALQSRAFGADAYDQVIAGNLAFYYLKQRPVRAEAARQMALYALTLPDARYPRGRIEDWTTLAVASALTGRERDARNAFFVTLALSDSIDRQCRNVLSSVAFYGERLRAPSEAMLARINGWGRSQESSFCRWPPSWSTGYRVP